MLENIDELKKNPRITCKLGFNLKNASVFISPNGYHFIDYLDDVDDLNENIDPYSLTTEKEVYITKILQFNLEKFQKQVRLIERYVEPKDSRVLDIGCGGGLFLKLLNEKSANTLGIELDDSRILYAQKNYKVDVIKKPVEDIYWKSNYASYFDLITLWDVLEHVNYPFSTLESAAKLLKKGGYIVLDTPCRDCFYHRVGVISYRLTNGKFPTFLNELYSAHPFGHKQIFSTKEMKIMLGSLGIRVISLIKVHELSFPYQFYLKNMFRSQFLAEKLTPLVKIFFSLFKLRNKMLVVAQKQ